MLNQIALVTGAAAGVGRAAVDALAADGFSVALLDRDGDGLATAHRELGANGATVHTVTCDVTDEASIERALADITDALGSPDVVVNNAGGSTGRAPVWELAPDEWDRVVALNLRSAFLVCHAALPAMVERGSGSVINIVSDQAFRPSTGRSAYAAAKAGLVGLTRALALEAAEYGVRVNAVAPGPTLTERIISQADEQSLQRLASIHPLGRLAEPSDVADTIAFLAGAKSRHITGQVLHVNGGLVLG